MKTLAVPNHLTKQILWKDDLEKRKINKDDFFTYSRYYIKMIWKRDININSRYDSEIQR